MRLRRVLYLWCLLMLPSLSWGDDDGPHPPNIYKWIEDNAHICTSVPSDRDTLITFLTESEGMKCSLCPEVKERQVPTSACAVETSFTISEVEIGCHPIPELCLLELKTRYADFFFPDIPFSPEAESIFLANANSFDFERNNIGGGILATKQPITMPVIIQSTIDLHSTEEPTTTTPLPRTTTVAPVFRITTSRALIPLKPFGFSNGFHGSPNPLAQPPPSFTRNAFKVQKRVNTSSRPCVDLHRLCCFWALAGECNSNPFWMRVKCPKTCGTCNCSMKEADKCVSTGVKCDITTTTTTTTTTTPKPTTTTSTTTTTTPPPTTTPAWVTIPSRQRPYGDRGAQTRRPPSFSRGMRPVIWPPLPTLYPPRTTTTTTRLPPTTTSTTTTTTTTTPIPTTTTPKTCYNYHELCSFWADLGECIKNPFWMRPHCQEACHSCGERLEDINAPVPRPNCNNHHKLCPFWTFIGECKNNPRWMLLHCRASCRVC